MTNGAQNIELLNRIKASSQNVVLTQGAKGSTIFTRDGQKLKIKAFRLDKDEIRSFTEAGDCYAAAFITDYVKSKDLKKAGVFASFFAAIKITELGIGVETTPTLDEVKAFIRQNKQRVREFLKSNNSENLRLFT